MAIRPLTGVVVEYDPIADLEPEILGAQFMVSDVYGGGFGVEFGAEGLKEFTTVQTVLS